MKTKIASLLFLSILVWSACNEKFDDPADDLNQQQELVSLSYDEYISIAYDTPGEISEEQILGLVDQFGEMGVQTRSATKVSVTINDKYYLKTGDGITTKSTDKGEGTIPVYRVNLGNGENKGMAFVVADVRFAKVMAYIPKVDDTDFSQTGAEDMLALSESSVLFELERYNQIKDSLRNKTLEKIGKELNIEKVEFDDVKDLLTIQGEITTKAAPIDDIWDYGGPNILPVVQSELLPRTKTKWSQNIPYNRKLPLGRMWNEMFEEEYYDNVPAGCSVTAIAQIITVLQPRKSVNGVMMNWSYLTENPTIVEPSYFSEGDPQDKRDMVALLFQDIYDKTQTTSEVDDAGYIVGSSTSNDKTLEYLRSVLNVESGIRSWDCNRVLNSLKANKLVWCGGQRLKEGGEEKRSHAWIIDGYCIATYSIGIRKDWVLDFFHANMGWAGTDDGYYLIRTHYPDGGTWTDLSWETVLGTYDRNIQIIPGISRSSRS